MARHQSAKLATAVRIRQVPHKRLSLSVFCFYELLFSLLIMKNIIIFLFLSLFFALACSPKQEVKDPIVAEVDGDFLYASDILKILPYDYTKTDSVQLSQHYIDNWKFERLAYAAAVEHVTDTTEIAQKIQRYRRQLYIDSYINSIIEKEINYVIDSSDIVKYYENHLDEYWLPTSYVKAHYIIFSANLQNYYHILDKMRNSSLDDHDALKKFCIGTNREVVFKKEWIALNDFLLSINYSKQMDDEDIQQTDILDFVDGEKRIIVKIDDYILKDDLAPLELVEKDIIQILINNRRRAKYFEIKNKIIQNSVN